MIPGNRRTVVRSTFVEIPFRSSAGRLRTLLSASSPRLVGKPVAFIAVCLASLVCGGSGFGQQPFPVRVVSLTGEEQSRQLIEISGGKAVFSDGELALDEILTMDGGKPAGVLASTKKFLVLSDGARVPFDAVTYEEEFFQVQAEWGTARLAPDCVAGLVLKEGADLTRFELSLKDRSVERDTIIAEGSDGQQVVSGLLESVDSSRARLNYQGESRSISLSRLVAIVTANISSPVPEGIQGTVKLANGGSFTGVPDQLKNGVLTLKLSGNSRVDIAFSAVAVISFSSGSFAWLSQLPMESSSFVPLTWMPFEASRDLNVSGDEMTLRWPSTGATRSFARGVGMRPTSRIEYRNDKGYKRLVAVVGIDAGTNGAGNCEVAVTGDGIRIWSAQISGKSDPADLNLSIEGMERIEISVRPGELLDIGDHVNWADARLVK